VTLITKPQKATCDSFERKKYKIKLEKDVKEQKIISFQCLATVKLRWDTLIGWYTKGQVEWSVWMSYIYWSSIDMIQSMCERARERGREGEMHA